MKVLGKWLETQRWTVAATILVALTYLWSISLSPKHVFWMPDEGAKYFQLHSTGLSWSEGVTYRIPFAGQSLVPGAEFLPGFDVYPAPSIAKDGSLYLPFDTPVLFPLLSAPFFDALGPAGVYVIPAASGVLIALLGGAMLAAFAPALAPAAVLIVGLATPVAFYSVVFWEHTLASLLGLTAVALFLRAPWRLDYLVACGTLVLAATTLRTEILALAVALGFAWATAAILGSRWSPVVRDRGDRRRRLLSWRVLPPLLLLTVVTAAFAEASLTLRHRLLLKVLPERFEHALAGLANLPQGLLEFFVHSDVSLGAPVGYGWIAAVTVALLLGLLSPWIRAQRVAAALLVTASAIMLFASASLITTSFAYRSIHGFFPAAPFLVVWPYAMRSAWKTRNVRLLALGLLILVYFAATFAAVSVTYLHRGLLDVGMEWGQRYLLTAYPILTALALVGMRDLFTALQPGTLRSATITLFTLLVVCGVALEARGLRMLYGTKSLMAGWDKAMRAEGPVLTTVWWIVPGVADLFVHHEMFFCWNDNLDLWVERASRHGVSSFTLASTKPIEDDRLRALGLRRIADRSRTVAGGLLLTGLAIEAEREL